MNITSPILDQWPLLRSFLPRGFDLEATAREAKAFQRARGVNDAETLLRLALGYGACGMSLRECCAWAAASGLAMLNDTALLKRLKNAADWLGMIAAAMLAERRLAPAGRWRGRRLRARDATTICAPGADGTTWRLHASLDLASGEIDELTLTDGRGAESLNRFIHRKGDIELVDRGYARPRDLRPVVEAGADFVVRIGWNSLRLLKPDGGVFDLFKALPVGGKREKEVIVHVEEGGSAAGKPPLPLRLVMRRKSEAEADAARKKLRKEATKRGKTLDPRSLEAAGYILLLTSLPADEFRTSDVLDLYRLRWQIELAFKRFKSLAGLDELPAKDPDLARAWIWARVIACLIADRAAGTVPDSPPCAPQTARR